MTTLPKAALSAPRCQAPLSGRCKATPFVRPCTRPSRSSKHLRRSRGAVRATATQEVEAGKLISKTEIPAFIPREVSLWHILDLGLCILAIPTFVFCLAYKVGTSKPFAGAPLSYLTADLCFPGHCFLVLPDFVATHLLSSQDLIHQLWGWARIECEESGAVNYGLPMKVRPVHLADGHLWGFTTSILSRDGNKLTDIRVM